MAKKVQFRESVRIVRDGPDSRLSDRANKSESNLEDMTAVAGCLGIVVVIGVLTALGYFFFG